jgi:hypothetical protein
MYLHYGLWVLKESLPDEIEILNLDRTIESVMEEYGLGVSFTIRKRVYPMRFVQKVDLKIMNDLEIWVLFTQIAYANIEGRSYNEEPVALKQAAILEVIEVMK